MARRRIVDTGSSLPPVPVNTVIAFDPADAGELIDAAQAGAGTLGVAGSWSVADHAINHTRVNDAELVAPFAFDCAGQLIDGTGKRGWHIAMQEAEDRKIAILSASAANPTVITTDGAHGFTTGMKIKVQGVTGSTPAVDGAREITVLSPTTFSLPLELTGAGTGGWCKPNFEGMLWFPGSGATDFTVCGLMQFAMKGDPAGLEDCAIDFFSIAGGDYSVCQIRVTGTQVAGNPDSTGAARTHSEGTGSLSTGDLTPGHTYLVFLRQDVARTRSILVVVEPTTMTVAWEVECLADDAAEIIYMAIQDYLSDFGGHLRTGPIGIAWGATAATFPPVPLHIPAPTSVVATQIGVGQTRLTWASAIGCWKIERRVNGGSWTSVNDDFIGFDSQLEQSGLEDGDSVEYRVSNRVGSQFSTPAATASPLAIDDSLFAAAPFITTFPGTFGYDYLVDSPAELGFKFTVGASPISIKALGVRRSTSYDADAYVVRLRSNAGTLLAEVTPDMSSVAEGQVAYVDITPVELAAGSVNRCVIHTTQHYLGVKSNPGIGGIVTNTGATLNSSVDQDGSDAFWVPHVDFKFGPA